MDDETKKTLEKIKKGENVFKLNEFFGIGDSPHLIKLGYAIICLILNLLTTEFQISFLF